MSQIVTEDPLVGHLISLKLRDDRGALAALRSGLGKRPGAAPRMFPYVSQYLSSHDLERPSVISAFLTASLFAKHPEHVQGRSLGLALWHATKRDANPNGKHGEAGVEARFAAMLDADEEDLPKHLEGLISLCESASVGLDWYQFRRDATSLLADNDERKQRTRLKLSRDFWQGESHKSTAETSSQRTES